MRDLSRVSFRARPGQDRFTIGRALERVLEINPRLEAAARAIDAARGSRTTAGLRINPNFTALGFNLNDFRQNQVYQVVQTFETGSKRGKRKLVASIGVDRATLGLADQRRILINETRQAFIAVLQALSDVEFAGKTLEAFERSAKARAGREPDRIANERIDLTNELDRASLAVELAKHRLAELVIAPDLWGHSDVDGGLAYVPADFSFRELHGAAFEHRPDWLSAEMAVEQARARLKLARAQKYWNVSVGPIVTTAPGGPTGYGALVSTSPQVFDRNQGEIAKEHENIKIAQADRDQVRFAIERELRQVYDRYRTNQRIVDNYRGGYLDRAARALHQGESDYRAGKMSITGFLDVLRAYRRINFGYRSALAQYLLALADLNRAAGQDLVEIDRSLTLDADEESAPYFCETRFDLDRFER